jgi:poly(3-hydroxybutyrate) depolymerase
VSEAHQPQKSAPSGNMAIMIIISAAVAAAAIAVVAGASAASAASSARTCVKRSGEHDGEIWDNGFAEGVKQERDVLAHSRQAL